MSSAIWVALLCLFALSKATTKNSPLLTKRDPISPIAFDTEQDHSYVYHLVNISVGTPPQNFRLRLNSAADSWLPDAASSLCDDGACKHGSFDVSASDTFQRELGTTFNDTVKMGGMDLTEVRLGLANVSDVPIGQLGLAPDPVASYGIVSLLKELDHIVTSAYSLYLDELNSTGGSLLFGAIDKAKYTGDLVAAPISSGSSGLQLTQLKISQPDSEEEPYIDKYDNITMSAKFYIGVRPTYLPHSWMNLLMYNMNGSLTDGYGPVVFCDTPLKESKLEFQFGGTEGPLIEVPLSGMMRPAMDGNTPLLSTTGQEVCYLDVGDIDDLAKVNSDYDNTTLLFGESFMRHAYMVFSPEDYHIALAQAKFGVKDSDVVEFTDHTIPEAITATISTTESSVATAPVGGASGTLNNDVPATTTGSTHNDALGNTVSSSKPLALFALLATWMMI
ncbi:hypothetical protein LTR70_001261 [Exophiala xenobiotica]|uniref:Peptidase A1 domain-containing protein n=1 Tax=Lithohypha guttulata TaxID=1690604 RepID=A0ABR0KKJ6_9EURO|nr:hypothetical protein LTR24_001512 [Lithohypha guttulata]KAK5328236.1 hypothetical protein LTR70_001261 [Exophiala xenobiotica]